MAAWISLGARDVSEDEMERLALALEEDGLGHLPVLDEGWRARETRDGVRNVLRLHLEGGRLAVVLQPLPRWIPGPAVLLPSLEEALEAMGERAVPLEVTGEEPDEIHRFGVLCRLGCWSRAMRLAVDATGLPVEDLAIVAGVGTPSLSSWLRDGAAPPAGIRAVVASEIEAEMRRHRVRLPMLQR